MRWLFGLVYVPELRWLVRSLKAEGDLRRAGLRADMLILCMAWFVFLLVSGLIACHIGPALPFLAAGMILLVFVILGLGRRAHVIRMMLLYSAGDYVVGEISHGPTLGRHGWGCRYRFRLPSGLPVTGGIRRLVRRSFPNGELPYVGDPIVVFYHPKGARLSMPFLAGNFAMFCASQSRYRTLRDSGLPDTDQLK